MSFKQPRRRRLHDAPVFAGGDHMSSENTARKFDLEPYYAHVEGLPTTSQARSGRSPGGLRSPAARR